MTLPDEAKSTRDSAFPGAERALLRAAQRARQRANISRTPGARNVQDAKELSFSQAQGYEEIPEQLQLEQLSSDARTQIWNLLFFNINQPARSGGNKRYLTGNWAELLKRTHCFLDNLALDDWSKEFDSNRKTLRHHIETDSFHKVFDRLQFIIRDKHCPSGFVHDLKRVFQISNLAYTIDNGPPPTIFPVATPEEGTVLIESLQTLRRAGLVGSSSHMRTAAEHINKRDWAGGVRESIHAVESVARTIDQKASRTLTPALNSIEAQGKLHGALKDAIEKLYGYTSDEQGIRHALLDKQTAKVGVEEAVFMLGACASFASYLWRKNAARTGS